MVSSMTGFARFVHEAAWGTLIWEIRTVNHRYLELAIRLPEYLRPWEMPVRERIQRVMGRGKVEATLTFIPGPEVFVNFVMNEPLIEQLSQASAIVQGFFPKTIVNPLEVLQWPGVLEVQQANREVIGASVLTTLEAALAELVAVRRREGRALQIFLQMCLQKTQEFVKVIREQLPRVYEQSREKIMTRLNELCLPANAERLEQELFWLLQKMDVAEELQRLGAHLEEVLRVLESDPVMGRRLDFLMQELNREANTLGSKSVNADVTQRVVEIKVLIEQMREQVQNIE